MHSKSLKRVVLILGGVLVLLVLGMLGIKKFTDSSISSDSVVSKVVTSVFTYPSELSSSLMEALARDDIVQIGEGIEPETVEESSFDRLLSESYSDYFTDAAYEKFISERYPLTVILHADANSCPVSVDDIQLIRKGTDSDNTYHYKVFLTIGENETKKVEQTIHIAYENGLISYFAFADDAAVSALDAED